MTKGKLSLISERGKKDPIVDLFIILRAVLPVLSTLHLYSVLALAVVGRIPIFITHIIWRFYIASETHVKIKITRAIILLTPINAS